MSRFDEDDEQLNFEEILKELDKLNEACWHTIIEYEGFVEKYKFCTKCQKKFFDEE